MSNTVKALLILGVLLTLIGIGGAVGVSAVAEFRAHELVASKGGDAEPADLADLITTALVADAVGLAVSLAGLVLIVVGVVLGVRDRGQAPKLAAPEQPLP
jgi:hypothetical protein